MSRQSHTSIHLRLISIALLSAAALVGGCGNEDAIVVRNVPKQPDPQTQPATTLPVPALPPKGDMPAAAAAAPTWRLPDGWTRLPGDSEIRFATIQVDSAHPDAQLTVIPLDGDSGGMLANVNRWRGQLGLPAISQPDVATSVMQANIAGANSYWVNLVGNENASPRLAMLAAAVPHDGRTWFFKLMGPPATVLAQKEKFETFLKTVEFSSSAASGSTPTTPDQSNSLQYAIPAGWVKDEPLPMRAVSFHIGEGEQKVDVIVSQLPVKNSGDELSNINRWRGQVALPPVAESEIAASEPIKVGAINGVLFEFIGPGDPTSAKRQVVARIMRNDDYWYFKMIGNSELVQAQRASFDQFLKSVQFTAVGDAPAKP